MPVPWPNECWMVLDPLKDPFMRAVSILDGLSTVGNVVGLIYKEDARK